MTGRDLQRLAKRAAAERRRVRNAAREYAALSILAEDHPDYMDGMGVTSYADKKEFMSELERIAGRIRKTINT